MHVKIIWLCTDIISLEITADKSVTVADIQNAEGYQLLGGAQQAIDAKEVRLDYYTYFERTDQR